MMPTERSSSVAVQPLSEVRHLIDAVVHADRATLIAEVQPSAPTAAPLAWWNMRDRALWLIDLFERLERQDRGHGRSGV